MNELKPRSAEQATCSAKAELAEADVMRALQCHSLEDISTCDDCPYRDISEQGNCGCDIARDALALLREKDALIEDYRQELGRARVALNDANVEIERLKAENAVYANGVEKVAENYHRQGRAEAITEFAERLKQQKTTAFGSQCGVVAFYEIDKIAKEMKGDQDA